MPAISTEKLLIALDQSGLLARDVLDEVRRRVGKAPGKVDPRSVTKYLVQKRHLTVEQGLERLRHLAAHGPTPYAFTFKTAFPAGEAEPVDLNPEPFCVGWA